MADDTPTPGASADDIIVRRAHKRFGKCQSWESLARQNWIHDWKFCNADSLNNDQWPSEILGARTGLPSLTVNQVRQHVLHIVNEAKQNKSDVKYRAIGSGATEEAAEIWEGIYRHIANISNAQMGQGVAINHQVSAGLGFTRITAEYVSQDSFDQDIFIRAIDDPMTVYLDCDAREPDASDARYGFIFADKPRDEMEEQYPQLKEERVASTNAVDGDDSGWIRDDHIREAEYYEVTEEKDELIGNDEGVTILKSETTPALLKAWEKEAKDNATSLKRRPVVTKTVHWYKIVGDIIVDETVVPGTSVPIIPWVGEVVVVDRILDRKGHTRALISAQQMLNYNWSASVQYGALQSKTPWIAPASAIEGYETYWNSANTENHSILPYNNRDEEGCDIPPPQRQEPPASAPVFGEGAQMAGQFMQAASGQYQAELGAPGNEKSGRAINERQRQSDRATYHFVDNQAIALRRHGQIVLEMAPIVYDTERMLKIIGEGGDESSVQVDPDAEAAHQAAVNGVAAIFNPKVGKYEVVSDVGPDYATQRQEAFNAIVQILTQAPELINKIGDLLFKVADFPLASEIAERLKPGVDPQVQKAMDDLQEQLANKTKLLGEAMQGLTEERLKVKARDATSVVDEFRADTERVDMLMKNAAAVDPAAVMAMIREMAQQSVMQAMQDNLGPVRLAGAGDLQTVAQGGAPPGATGAIPAPVPNVGQQAAQPGGM